MIFLTINRFGKMNIKDIVNLAAGFLQVAVAASLPWIQRVARHNRTEKRNF